MTRQLWFRSRELYKSILKDGAEPGEGCLGPWPEGIDHGTRKYRPTIGGQAGPATRRVVRRVCGMRPPWRARSCLMATWKRGAAWPSSRRCLKGYAQNRPYTFHPPALLWSKRRYGVSTTPTIARSVDGKTGRRRPWIPLANTKQTDDPHDASPGLSTQDIELVARADERLAHAYDQIARADEQLARLMNSFPSWSKMPRRRSPLNGVVGHRVAGRRYAASSACCWQRAFCRCFRFAVLYGETAKLMISRWAPQLARLRRCRRKHRSSPPSRAHLPFSWLRRTLCFRK